MPIRHTIEEMQKWASELGGKCLSKEYWDEYRKLSWMCGKGHTWEASYDIIIRGAWCPRCVKDVEKEERLETIRLFAKEKGGECLNKEYKDSKADLQFRCGEGHLFTLGMQTVKKGSWCPVCSRIKKNEQYLINIKALVRKKGGECLSDVYTNTTTKLHFQCSEGHQWFAPSKEIIHGAWCLKCCNKRIAEQRIIPLEVYKKVAIERGGKLLSDDFKDGSSKLLWECSEGHQWYASGSDVKNGKHWCPHCLGMIKTIKDMHEYAAGNGGKCLSDVYVNSTKKLEWQCSEGHIWKATPQGISIKRWCPVCGIEKSHKQSRNDIEIYRKIAIERGGKLLSDSCTSGKQKLLWECSKGHQWSAQPASIKNSGQWCPYCAGKVQKTIKEMQELAAKKGGLCLSDFYVNVKTKLEWQCKEGHTWKSCPTNIIDGNWCPVCGIVSRSQKAKHGIELFRKIAEEKGGKLLSDTYINYDSMLLWECSEGHQWEALGASVKYQNAWCPYCSGRKKTIEYLQEIVAKRGGKCLSEISTDNHTKLKWQCSEGHVWETYPKNILANKWCHACGVKINGKKLRGKIEDFQRIAIEKGGRLLSEEYVGCNTSMLWQCSEGHQWEASPNDIKNIKKWCPQCKKSFKKNKQKKK